MAIPTEQEWISLCMSLGFSKENIQALRKLYRKTHAKKKEPTGRFVVYQGSIMVKRSFPSKEAAKDWAIYNYKHQNCWHIEPEMKLVYDLQ